MTAARSGSPLAFVALGGVVAGVLDIVYAMAFWGFRANVPATRILQSVAAGVLGRASFQGGAGTATLGLVLHFFIAMSMSITYYFFAKRWTILHRRPWSCGAVYGVALYVVMNFVVVPLSAATPGSNDALWVALSVLVHMFLIGVPIAVASRAALKGREA